MTDLVVLVGGKGKRLGTLTKKTPKPLIKINKKPFLDILLSKLISYEFNTIYLLCSYKKKLFFRKYHRTKLHKSRIICIDEGKQTEQGIVEAVGPGSRNMNDGQHMPMDIEVGDKIIYTKFSAVEITHNGKEFFVVTERDIIAKIEE